MTFLHIADSASHAALGGPVGMVAATVGVVAGAFVVFGLPAIRERRRASSKSELEIGDGEDDT